MTDGTDFDGCNRKCRKKGAHTLVWHECEYAPEPEPTVSMLKIYTAADGCPAIGSDTYTVDQLAELLDPVLGSVAMREREGSVDLAHLAAHAIVHRNDEPKPTQPAPGTAAPQTAEDTCTDRCNGVHGIRGLLEHVGIDTRGQDITVDGRSIPRLTARPVSPEEEAAATARAVQAAADSERAAEWIAAHNPPDAVTDELRQQRDQLAGALAEILAILLPARNEHGTIVGYAPPYPVTPAEFNRWRAVIDQTQEQPDA